MALRKRLLKITFTFPGGQEVELDEELMLVVKIKKSALSVQNSATIEIGGMSQTLRETLMSQFNIFQNRRVQQGDVDATPVDVEIYAGYEINEVQSVSKVFRGQVVVATLVSPPPNIVMSLTCYTRQVDRSKYADVPPPTNITLKAYVAWIADQMGFGTRYVCDTTRNDSLIENPAVTAYTISALIIDLQRVRDSNITAFVDDDLLIVKDTNNIINPNSIPTLDEFIGMPSWNEWGIEFQTLMDSNVRLAQGVIVKSKMNPSIENAFVVTTLEYNLATRELPFYVKGFASPPA